MLFLILVCGPSYSEDEIQIEIDGDPLILEIPPQIEDGRALVPFKAIFEALGLNISWNNYLRIATAYNEEISVSIKLNESFGNINGELIALDVPGQIKNGRTLVPLKFISEAFGNEVSWDPVKRLISIKSGFKPLTYTNNLPTVDSNEKLRLLFEYAEKYTQYYVPPSNDYVIEEMPLESIDEPVADLAPIAEPDHSDTNVQVNGVDEADIIKTDGNLIYQLRGQDIKITDISGEQMKVISTIMFDDNLRASEFYLYKNMLIVIARKEIPYAIEYPSITPATNDLIDDPDFYLYDVPPIQYPSTILNSVLFYDISIPTDPNLIRTFDNEGNLFTSRVTDGKLYMVQNAWMSSYNYSSDNPIPDFTDTLIGNGKDEVKTITVGLDELKYFPDSIERSLLITLGFDLDALDKNPDINVFLGNSSTVYASSNTMIVAMERYQYKYQMNYDYFAPVNLRFTDLYKFELSNGTFQFSSKGTVPGNILNQFSIDAYNDQYRVATTSGETWLDNSQNNLYVFDSKMNLTGKLEGLAPGERIFSARFAGDRAYLVTFRQVDPFYVIDLKDASRPTILGYLKIPGYSDYLHPYGENSVIGFGREMIDTGNGQMLGGIKIALFDVSDVSNPVEKSKISLGSSYSYTEVLNNHKSLLFSYEKNLFALPVTLYEGDNYENKFVFQGAYVYIINPEVGFILLGKSSHLTQKEIEDNSLYWYDTSKYVSRIIWSGNKIYTVSNYGIKSHDIKTMKEIEFMIY